MMDAAIISVVRDSITAKVGFCRQYFFLMNDMSLIQGIQLLAFLSVMKE